MSDHSPTDVLVIVARMPVAGTTKTRLGAEIDHAAAAALYAGFVADLAQAFRPTPDYDVIWRTRRRAPTSPRSCVP